MAYYRRMTLLVALSSPVSIGGLGAAAGWLCGDLQAGAATALTIYTVMLTGHLIWFLRYNLPQIADDWLSRWRQNADLSEYENFRPKAVRSRPEE
jgi:hypothetical protein